jgi:hypothetical protein
MATGAARVGKSVDVSAGEIVPWSLHSQLIWIVAPKYRLARREFIYAMEALMSLKLLSRSDVSLPSRDMPARMTTRTGCEIVTNTTHDIEELVAEAPDLVVVAEMGLIEEEILQAMRIRLTTRRGMLFLTGTLKRANPWVGNAYLRWQDWPNYEGAFAVNVPLWENLYDFPGASSRRSSACPCRRRTSSSPAPGARGWRTGRSGTSEHSPGRSTRTPSGRTWSRSRCGSTPATGPATSTPSCRCSSTSCRMEARRRTYSMSSALRECRHRR